MTANDWAALEADGVVLLRGLFPRGSLNLLRAAACRCFEALETGPASLAARYLFSPISSSVRLPALLDFGAPPNDLVSPLDVDGFELGNCTLEESWVRKRYAPAHAPRHHCPNLWHQDGGLSVAFPVQPGPVIPMTSLTTCWLPLDPCGDDRPSLEFVRHPLDALLHFTELDDGKLRQRFPPEDFWAPRVEPGDGLVILNGTLHRTYVRPDMRHNRLSVEYRFFPGVLRRAGQ